MNITKLANGTVIKSGTSFHVTDYIEQALNIRCCFDTKYNIQFCNAIIV